MKKLLLLALLTLTQLTHAQWVAQMHSRQSAQSIAMGTDNAENVYIAGIFTDTLYLFSQGKAQTISLNMTGTGLALSVGGFSMLTQKAANNVFLCKYTKDGDLVWTKTLGQVTPNEPTRDYLSLQVDWVGNSYLFAYWNANCTMSGFDCNDRKPGLIKFNTAGDTTWVKYVAPASSIFEGYLEMSQKDEELFLSMSATTTFTFGGQAFANNANTFAIKADGSLRVVSLLPGASPMLVYPCGNTLYKYGNNLIYRDSANTVGRTVLSITGAAKILKLDIDSLGYITGIGKFKDASIVVAGQALTNSRPSLTNAWDVFAFKIKKSGEKVWVRNILSWETGTGNGYIGMAVDSENNVEIATIYDSTMRIIGVVTKYIRNDFTNSALIRVMAQGNEVGFRPYKNISSKDLKTQISISKKADKIIIYTHLVNESIEFSVNGSPQFTRVSNNILSSIGNGLLLVKGNFPPPPI